MTANPFQKATRAQLKARVAFAGPTGSGKTWTALEWATVLAGDTGRIAVVDTERGSAALYADRFDFDVLAFDPPYDPGRLADILKAAETHGYAVVVVDSLSHFWEGEGGTRDIVDAAAERAKGNTFAGWKVGTPALRHLIDTMLGLDAHFLATMRSKMEYVLETDSRGKQVPKKVGLAPVMRAGVEYEFTLVGDIDLEHRIIITKSRCDRLADELVQPGRADEAAKVFAGWLGEGEPLATKAEVDALVARMNALPEHTRKECKAAFVAEVGSPQSLRQAQLAAADALVARFEAEGPNPDGPPSGQGPAPAGPPPVSSGGGTSAEVPSEREPQAQEPASSPDDGTGEEAGATALSGAVTPGKDTDPDAWGRWNRRCQAKATKVLAEDSAVRDAQRHGLAWQASSKLRGAGVESWNELTEPEADAVEDALEQLKAGAAFMVADGDRWSCGLGAPPVDAELVDEDPLDLLARAVADAGWTQAKATRRARAIAEELGLQKLPTQWDTLPRFPRVLAALAAELAEEAA